MNFRKYVMYTIIAALAISCNDPDEEENFGINISPEENYLSRKTGSLVNFTINIQSAHNLTRYRVTETIDEFSTNTLKEESVGGKFHSDWFDYTVPDTFGFGKHEIKLIFSALDVRGREMKRAKIINVNVSDRTLTEYGGNTMYSSISNGFDAYDLLSGTPKYSSDTTSHIIDLTKANPTDSLSKSWTSPVPEIKFVRFNNFDYGNASNQSVKTAYETGIKNDTIRNLKADDVLLSKINDKYVAIKLVYVFDVTGKESDRYIFSIKR